MDYKYMDLPFTGIVAKELIIDKLTPNKIYKKEEILEEIYGFHLKNGGSDHQTKDLWRNSFKSVLGKLKKEGKAIDPQRGYWKLLSSQEMKPQEIKKISQKKEEIKKETQNKKDNKTDIFPKYILGDEKSEGFVYLYYYESYKTMKNENKEWECKIGKTSLKDYNRIYSQVGTAMPEEPILEMVIYHKNYSDLERAIHSYLRVKNKNKNNARGTEWFIINPQEIFDYLLFNKIINYSEIKTFNKG